jgi:pimeloyl-ACP methyl ester carboxylesterase
MTLKFLPLIFFFSIVVSCNKEGSDSEELAKGLDAINLDDSWRNLESHSYTFNAAKGRKQAESMGLIDVAAKVQYDVSVQTFTYQTTYKGSSITASGAIAIPIHKQNPPIMVYHHGTMFYKAYAPSMQKRTSEWGMELTASNGYIVFLPDYIGYGASSDILHPYHLYRPTVDASIDMILAGKEFLRKNGIGFRDDGIFLSGFSEGGYAAFAVQKEIETHTALGITLKASAPGAGAYDVGYQFDITTNNDLYPGPGYMGLALSAYNEYYFHEPLTYFFTSPYAEKIPDLLSGKYTEDYVHHQLPNKLSQFIEPKFLKSFKTDPAFTFTLHLMENNLNNFVVRTPTRFFHGTKDTTVPFAVAQKAYQNLLDLGTDKDVLQLHAFDGGHDDLRYLCLMLDWFNSFE